MDPTHVTTPGTLVQVGAQPGEDLTLSHLRYRPPPAREVAPEVALLLAAVLAAAAEQVSEQKLAAFGVRSRTDLTLLALAMAFRGDDTGLVGDVFEWSLLLALNSGDPAVVELISDALLLAGVRVEAPQAVLVAAEPGRLVAYSPELPPGATLATGRRGRPPQVANLLRNADTRTWKADLLLGGTDERWVSASLKSNPRDLKRSLALAVGTPHPPRIGITASHVPGLTRDPATGAVLAHVPVHSQALALSRMVLTDVLDAFSRHLTLPGTPLRQDATGIGRQLHRWQDRTVDYAFTTLLQRAEGRMPLFWGPPRATGASVPDAQGAVITVNTLHDARRWHENRNLEALRDRSTRRRFGQFDPID